MRGFRVGRPVVTGAVLPHGPGLRRRRCHVLVRLPGRSVRGGTRREARVLRGRSRLDARLRAGAAALPHRLALRARRGRALWLPLMPGPLPELYCCSNM
jgi:hypothetical protein